MSLRPQIAENTGVVIRTTLQKEVWWVNTRKVSINVPYVTCWGLGSDLSVGLTGFQVPSPGLAAHSLMGNAGPVIMWMKFMSSLSVSAR